MRASSHYTKIAVIHPHLEYPTGATKYLMNLLHEFTDNQNFEIILILLYAKEPLKKEISNRIRIIELNEASPKSYSFWFRLYFIRKKIQKIIEKEAPHLVISNVFPANWMTPATTKFQIPSLWICHEPSAYIYYKHLRKGLSKKMEITSSIVAPLAAQIDKQIIKRFSVIVANSQFTKKEIKKIYHQTAVTIYPGVDPYILKSSYVEPPTESYFGTISSLTRQSRLEFIFKAIKILKNRKRTKFKFFIGGDGLHKKFYMQLARKLKIDDTVIFYGYIPPKSLPSFYSNLQFVVYPRYNESFGLVPIEAMAMGRPVIACNGGGVRETIIHKHTGYLIDPFNPYTLANRIELLLKNYELVKKMGQVGLTHVKSKFTWEKAKERYKRLFNYMMHK